MVDGSAVVGLSDVAGTWITAGAAFELLVDGVAQPTQSRIDSSQNGALGPEVRVVLAGKRIIVASGGSGPLLLLRAPLPPVSVAELDRNTNATVPTTIPQ